MRVVKPGRWLDVAQLLLKNSDLLTVKKVVDGLQPFSKLSFLRWIWLCPTVMSGVWHF